VVVIDNVALGPALCVVTMAPDISLASMTQSARYGTLMHAAASVPHGGAEAVVLASTDLDRNRKRTLLRCFASALNDRRALVASPGDGVDAEGMGWMLDEGMVVAGRPPELGGSALDRAAATGLGVTESVRAAVDYCDIELSGARVVLSGFDGPARQAGRYLADAGATIIGITDSRGAVHDPEGLNVYELASCAEDGQPVSARPGTKPTALEAMVGIDCDIRIEAGPHRITPAEARELRARLVVEAARSALPLEAELALRHRGIACLPALVAGAGGAIAQSLELRGVPSQSISEVIRQRLMDTTHAVLSESSKQRRLPSEVTCALARRRLENAIAARRWSVFAGFGGAGSELRDPRANFDP
jgi:glutamate dehydrogenase (NAD(P)+)